MALIDGGEKNTGILPFLQSLGIARIDLMVATHPHADHIGGLVQVLEVMPVSQVVTNGQISTTSTFEQFLNGVARDQAAFSIAKQGDILNAGAMTISVLSPASLSSEDSNNNSLVLRLDYGQVSFLFMGDADQEAETTMVNAGLVSPVDILKVGHHASGTASSLAFLSAAAPSVAIYTAGTGNTYGHPHAITLSHLADAGAEIYGTDVNGTILVTTDGETYQVDTSKGETVIPPLPSVTP